MYLSLVFSKMQADFLKDAMESYYHELQFDVSKSDEVLIGMKHQVPLFLGDNKISFLDSSTVLGLKLIII